MDDSNNFFDPVVEKFEAIIFFVILQDEIFIDWIFYNIWISILMFKTIVYLWSGFLFSGKNTKIILEFIIVGLIKTSVRDGILLWQEEAAVFFLPTPPFPFPPSCSRNFLQRFELNIQTGSTSSMPLQQTSWPHPDGIFRALKTGREDLFVCEHKRRHETFPGLRTCVTRRTRLFRREIWVICWAIPKFVLHFPGDGAWGHICVRIQLISWTSLFWFATIGSKLVGPSLRGVLC